MVADEKHKQVNLDINTYATIQMHAKRANRSIAGEVRELCAIVYTPRDGKEVVTGLANVIRAGGETVVENALENKTVIATGRHITHEPAYAPVDVFPTQPIEEKEFVSSDTDRE